MGRSNTKRKAGHLGFQANELAFIEDEMAALAAEYGLQVDAEVAARVSERQDHKKKARLRRQQQQQPTTGSAMTTTTTTTPPPVVRLRAPARRRVVVRQNFDGDHELVHTIVRNVLPENVVLAACAVPGCGCSRGHRELVLVHDEPTSEPLASECDVVRRGACKKCHHGVLQHKLMAAPDASDASGGQRLLGALYQLIRTGRLAATVFRSRVWVACVLELLEALLVHLKKNITAGGTHNGQKTLAELHQEQTVLAELTSLRKKAETASQKAVSRDELPIELANAFDPMYFRVYYACIAVYGRACAAVPPPEDYFGDIESFTPDVHALVETFVNQELAPRGDSESEIPTTLLESLALPLVESATSNRKKKKELQATQTGAAGSGIALLDIYHTRFREGVRLFYEHSIGMHGEMDAVLSNAGGALTGAVAAASVASGSKKKPHRREKESVATTKDSIHATTPGLVEMPAYELLAQWRNNCRDWCCHLYAYATPTNEALDVMARYAPLVEIGAGTGYWASLLAARGVDVMAYDVCPPSLHASARDDDEPKSAFAHLKKKKPSNEPKQNAYHGEVPTFTSVAKGGPETLKTDEATHARTLFLCYPPPHDEMARLCLKHFKGEHVVYVGEWQGDTGDREFEKELVKKFTNVEEVELPNWGNSAYSLTVWKRKRSGAREASILKRLSCFHCHASLLDVTTDDDAEDFKRCTLCKTNLYCSEDCSDAHRRAHSAEHAKRLVFLEDEAKLDYENDLHFKPMVALATEVDGDESDEDEDKVVVAKANWKALTKSSASTESSTDTTSSNGGSSFAFNFGS